ncbi:hypothetical protein AERO9A_400094 [Aeromonas salmonicida]|nr:hypothetical protein AERO9A_400094 [Aeromonas salmonicida]
MFLKGYLSEQKTTKPISISCPPNHENGHLEVTTTGCGGGFLSMPTPNVTLIEGER